MTRMALGSAISESCALAEEVIPGLVGLPSAGYQEACKIRRSRW